MQTLQNTSVNTASVILHYRVNLRGFNVKLFLVFSPLLLLNEYRRGGENASWLILQFQGRGRTLEKGKVIIFH
jgi:hypothetical protein